MKCSNLSARGLYASNILTWGKSLLMISLDRFSFHLCESSMAFLQNMKPSRMRKSHANLLTPNSLSFPLLNWDCSWKQIWFHCPTKKTKLSFLMVIFLHDLLTFGKTSVRNFKFSLKSPSHVFCLSTISLWSNSSLYGAKCAELPITTAVISWRECFRSDRNRSLL